MNKDKEGQEIYNIYLKKQSRSRNLNKMYGWLLF